MPATLIRASDGDLVNVQEGESCNIVATFKDLNGNAIVKASLITLTMTLALESTSAAINGRGPTPQNVLDANGGTVASDGTLTLRLQPADNSIIGTPLDGTIEVHVIEFEWTWNDGVAVRTGHSGPLGIYIENRATIVA